MLSKIILVKKGYYYNNDRDYLFLHQIPNETKTPFASLNACCYRAGS